MSVIYPHSMSESERVSIEAAVACMGLKRGDQVFDVELTDQIRGALDGGKVFRIDSPPAPVDGEAVGDPVPPVTDTGGPADPPKPPAPAPKSKTADGKDQAGA